MSELVALKKGAKNIVKGGGVLRLRTATGLNRLIRTVIFKKLDVYLNSVMNFTELPAKK